MTNLTIALFLVLACTGCKATSAGQESSGPADGPVAGGPSQDASAGADAPGLEVALNAGPPAPPRDAAPGSSACGPKGDSCNALGSRCQYCDASGSPWLCGCSAAGKWECAAGDGACGVACGDRRCFPDEL